MATDSNLSYAGGPGGLNEGVSDIFAAYCESWTSNGSTGLDMWAEGWRHLLQGPQGHLHFNEYRARFSRKAAAARILARRGVHA